VIILRNNPSLSRDDGDGRNFERMTNTE
jgi:hypothetical protein